MKLKDIFSFFTDTIFRRDESHWRNPAVRWLVRQYKMFFYTARGVMEHDTFVRSAALTFYTLMSLVPILAVLFAIVKGFGLTDKLIENLYTLFPNTPELVQYLLDFAEKALARTRGGLVAAVALITLLWAVIRVFASIESAFNNIWEVKSTRSLTRQYTDYIAMLFLVPILWIAANSAATFAQEFLGGNTSWYFILLSKVGAIAVVWLMFTLLYLMIPNTKVQFGSALRAAIIAGTMFLVFQWGYIYLQRWMTSYNAIYGSFVALPLLLVWLQTSWQIFLFGGELSFAYQHIARFDEERESLLISHDMRRKIILATMLIVARHFRHEGGALSSEEIRERLNLPTRIVNDILYELLESELLVAVRTKKGAGNEEYIPACDPTRLTIFEIINKVETSRHSDFQLPSTTELQRVEKVLEQFKQEFEAHHDKVLLTELTDEIHESTK